MHKAIVSRVDRVIPISGADKIQEVVVLGEHLVVSKDISVGDIGILFPVDLQLSDQFCHENNLFRDATKNRDKGKSGFFEDNRRVRAQPFLKVKSSGLFMPLYSVEYAGVSLTENDLGLEFDVLNGIKICEKYISVEQKRKIANSQTKSVKKAEYPLFDKHQDTEQFNYKVDQIPVGALISFHQKKHGTSFRVGKKQQTVVLPKWKRWVNRLIPLFPEKTEYKLVVGTRNVIIENRDKIGYNGSEGFRFEVADTLFPYMEDGMEIMGEIVGYANGKPIMPNHDVKVLKDKSLVKKFGETNVYSYGCKPHEYKFHVYRITRETVDGKNVDMSQKEMERWCEDRNIPHTFEIHPQMLYDGDVEKLKTLAERLSENTDNLYSDYEYPEQIGEGLVIRIDTDGHQPYFLKRKGFAFRCMEGLCQADDVETES